MALLPLVKWGEGWRVAVTAAGNTRIVLKHTVLPCTTTTQAAGRVQGSLHCGQCHDVPKTGGCQMEGAINEIFSGSGQEVP